MRLDMVIPVVSILISLIAIFQARQSNNFAKESKEVAKKANEISEEAKKIAIDQLNDTTKDYMPIVILDKEIKCETLSIEELCSKVTFDFKNLLNAESYVDDNDYYPIVITIKNIGRGIICKVEINSILICEGNKNRFEKCFPDNGLNSLEWYEPCACEQEFYLDKDQKIYLLLSDKDYNSFFNSHKEILVMMNLVLYSINKSTYRQTIWGNFSDGNIMLCSFDAAARKDDYNTDKKQLHKN